MCTSIMSYLECICVHMFPMFEIFNEIVINVVVFSIYETNTKYNTSILRSHLMKMLFKIRLCENNKMFVVCRYQNIGLFVVAGLL